MQKFIRKSFAVLLSAVLIITGIVTVFAAETQNDSYVISSAEELSALAASVNGGNSMEGKYYKLSANITADSNFTAIGTNDNPFSGTFDGDGHTITGASASSDIAGVFGVIKNAEIKNLTVRNASFRGTSASGGIAAIAENSKISDCTVHGRFVSTSYAGGIVGKTDNTEILNCNVSAGTIVSATNYCGGISAYNGGTVTKCTSSGTISGGSYIGGIAGFSNGKISSCTNNARITVNKEIGGGIAGFASGQITLCSNKGSVIINNNSGAGKTGGIAGTANDADISLSYNSGNVSADGDYCAGIAAIVTGGRITNCYNAGNISSEGEYAAGIFAALTSATVQNSYNAGEISGNSSAGIGGSVSGNVINCYSVDSSAKKFIGGSGTAKIENTALISASDMKNESSFAGFDFNNTWEINGLHSYDFPVLKDIDYHTLQLVTITTRTCTQNAERISTCSSCGATVSVIVEKATGHSYEKTASVPVSCTEDGYNEYKCKNCNESYRDNFEALGHTDADNNKICDRCSEKLEGYIEPEEPAKDELNTLQKILKKISDFFNGILNFIKNLFSFIKFN